MDSDGEDGSLHSRSNHMPERKWEQGPLLAAVISVSSKGPGPLGSLPFHVSSPGSWALSGYTLLHPVKELAKENKRQFQLGT